MGVVRFIWDKRGRKQSFIDLDIDFEDSTGTRETLIYGGLAIEELCYVLYETYLKTHNSETKSRLKKFRTSRFAEKINLLELLNVIDFKLGNNLRKIKDARNEAAHNLIFGDIKYCGVVMPVGLAQFKKDCLKIWEKINYEIDSGMIQNIKNWSL
ncbi:MAG: DUF4145 domain-containing protein [archaeon]